MIIIPSANEHWDYLERVGISPRCPIQGCDVRQRINRVVVHSTMDEETGYKWAAGHTIEGYCSRHRCVWTLNIP